MSTRSRLRTAARGGWRSRSTICCSPTPSRHTDRERAMGEARILLRDSAELTSKAPAEVERKLSVPELLWNDGFVRKGVIIIFLAAAWQIYGTVLNNPLLFPTFSDTVTTMWDKVRDGTIPLRAWAS